MTIKGMYRQDVYELPTDSIRELIDFDGDFRVNMYRKRDANTETNTETNTEKERCICYARYTRG